jgi:polyisoprenoid-binding protein YceI
MKTALLLLTLAPLIGGGLRAADRPLAIDPTRSRVEIEVQATVDSFTGRLDVFVAEVQVDPVAERVTGARFSFHFSDVHTGKEGRDEQMHAWQDTPRHPDGVFTLASLTAAADGSSVARGTLTFHDQVRELEFPVTVTHEGARYAIDGDAALDTREFGLPVIRKFALLKVAPVVHVRFHLQGSLEPEVAVASKAAGWSTR